MRGDSESASKNTSKPVFKCPKYSNIRIFENSLASDLVFVFAEYKYNLTIDMILFSIKSIFQVMGRGSDIKGDPNLASYELLLQFQSTVA